MKIAHVLFYHEGLEECGSLCSVIYPAYKKTNQEILAYEPLVYHFQGITYKLVSVTLKNGGTFGDDHIFWSNETGFYPNFPATGKFQTSLSRIRQGDYNISEKRYGRAVLLAKYQKN